MFIVGNVLNRSSKLDGLKRKNRKERWFKMASKKNRNPYREGSAYANIFEYIRKAPGGIVTRSELLEQGFSVSDVTVVLSPRAEGASTRGGDCRGNLSAQGHVYFMEKKLPFLKKGEPKRFRLRYRAEVLEKLVRPPKKVVKSQKEANVAEVSNEVSNEVSA